MINLTITAPLYSVTIGGDDSKDIIRQAAFWQSLPTKCPKCERPLIFEYKTPRTFKYYVLKCTGTPAHSVNLGIKQGSEDLYFDASKPWEVFRPGQHNDDATPEPASGSGTPTRPAVAEAYGENAPIGTRKDVLIKLINDCKNAGIRTGLTPADVGPLEPEQVTTETARISALFARGPA